MFRKYKLFYSIILTCITLTAFLFAVPNTVNFQGTLSDITGAPISGLRSIKFAFYTYHDAATDIWHETQDVQVTDGLYTVQLGSETAFQEGLFAEPELWLGVKVGDENEQTPRIRILSVPYSLYSKHSEKADVATAVENNAIGSDQIADGVITTDDIQDSTIVNADLLEGLFPNIIGVGDLESLNVKGGVNLATVSGNVGIGMSNPSTALDIAGGIKASNGLIITGGTVAFPIDSISSSMIRNNTISNSDLAAGSFSNITGVGPLGALTVTGNTNLATTSGAIGIGTTNPDPGVKLDVNGDVSVTGDIKLEPGNTLFTSFIEGNSPLVIKTNGVERFRIADDPAQDQGNLGVGTSVPKARLHVNGSFEKTLTGTASVGIGNRQVTGSGTQFQTELKIGDSIIIGDETHSVFTIDTDVSLLLSRNHINGATNATVLKIGDIIRVEDNSGSTKLVINDENISIGNNNPNLLFLPFNLMNMLFINGPNTDNYMIGIGTTTPTEMFDIIGGNLKVGDFFNGGKIGIGINPVNPLHIKAVNDGNEHIRLDNLDSTKYWEIGVNFSGDLNYLNNSELTSCNQTRTR